MTPRRCRICGVEKDRERDFFKMKNARDGYELRCKACRLVQRTNVQRVVWKDAGDLVELLRHWGAAMKRSGTDRTFSLACEVLALRVENYVTMRSQQRLKNRRESSPPRSIADLPASGTRPAPKTRTDPEE